MRIAFFVLLLANLLFLGWAEWIAVPALRADPLSGVPRLQLVGRDVLPPAAPASGAADAPAGALSAALAHAAAASASGRQAGATALQCLSVGPFNRSRRAAEAASVLRARHFASRLRITAVRPVHWYWVYLPSVSGSARVQHTLNKLHHDGIDGAEPMTTVNGKPGISLGLFRDPALAQRRLVLARAKGFAAELTGRLVARPAYWLDLWAAGGAGALPMKALHTKLGSTVGTQACPSDVAPPLPSTATGAVAPGVPLPGDRATASPLP